MKVVALFPQDKDGQYENQLISDHNALGLKEHLGDDHELVIINSDDELDDHIEDVEVIISSPFLPAYVTEERQKKAENLNLSITAGVGSDHVDLDAAQENDIAVVEVTGSNQVSTAEHAVLTIILLLRNFQEGNRQAMAGEWDLPKVGNRAYDVENKTIGIMGYGLIGQMVAERLEPFGVEIQHYDPSEDEDTELSKAVSFDELLETSDVITLHTPLTDSTEGIFNKDAFDKMKDGAYLVNVARGAIVNRDDLVDALENDKLNGYGGDVWEPQPASEDHPWRDLPETRSAMVPHMGGMTIDAQKRIEDGVKELLDAYINDEEFPEKHIVVDEGQVKDSYTV
jgi:formate dehydrogenase